MKRLSIILGFLLLTFSLFGQDRYISANVNFRETPELKGNKICTIPQGTAVTLIPDTVAYEKWSKVNYNGRAGYVCNEFLVDFLIDSHTSKTGLNYYTNSKGEKVQSPTHYQLPPAGATAECRDGTYSFSHSRRGTCSHHGGVKKWLQ